MSIGWNFYFSSIEGNTTSIALDFNLRESAPDPARPHLLRIKLRMLEPRSDGLSSSEEAQALWGLEDALSNQLHQVCNARFIARITGNNHREWLFYAASIDFADEVVSSTLQAFPGYRCTVAKTSDPGWRIFIDEIYPSEEEEQWILNRIVLDKMQEKGDKLDSTRDARHFIFFRDPEHRSTFRNSAHFLGYEMEDEWESAESPYKFWICVSKTQEMTWRALHDDFIKLFHACRASSGTYDGWECETVVKQ
jgi:regulator of RNase E activity RraB